VAPEEAACRCIPRLEERRCGSSDDRGLGSSRLDPYARWRPAQRCPISNRPPRSGRPVASTPAPVDGLRVTVDAVHSAAISRPARVGIKRIPRAPRARTNTTPSQPSGARRAPQPRTRPRRNRADERRTCRPPPGARRTPTPNLAPDHAALDAPQPRLAVRHAPKPPARRRRRKPGAPNRPPFRRARHRPAAVIPEPGSEMHGVLCSSEPSRPRHSTTRRFRRVGMSPPGAGGALTMAAAGVSVGVLGRTGTVPVEPCLGRSAQRR
jgi:hypothetical protein